MQATPRVRVVVVTWNGAHLLSDCLGSLRRQSVAPLEVVVVDNASADGTIDLVTEQFPEVTLVRSDRNLGFAGGVALGTADFDGDYIALLNNDAQFAPDAIERMVDFLESPEAARVGAVTAKILLVGADTGGRQRVNSTGNVIARDGTGADRDWLRQDGSESTDPDVFGFCGGAAVLRGAALREVGGFDPSLFLYYEDTDLSWRLRAGGWTVRYVAEAVAQHRHAASTGVDSPVFRFYNTRNSLVVFTRHAPLGVVVGSVARQVAGLIRALLRDGPGPGTRARARALGAYAARLRQTLRERREMWSGSVATRAEVARYLQPRRLDRADAAGDLT